MYTLYGVNLSNYYSKVKLCLLELDLPFTEQKIMPAKTWPDSGSPSGKIPYLQRPDGVFLYETQAIVEYLCAEHNSSLIPADPLQAAKVREMLLYLELYLIPAVEPIYPMAFWGKEVDNAVCEQAVTRAKAAMQLVLSRATFSPYLVGDQFTLADVGGWVHFSLVKYALKGLGLENIFADTPIEDYLALCAQRPSIQKLEADKRQPKSA